MAIDSDELFRIIAELCEKEKLRAAVKGSVKGGILTGCAAIAGGLLLGPVGLALGGALGGGACAASAANSFQPVGVILMNMTKDEKRRLYNRVLYAFRNFGIEDVLMTASLLMSTSSLQSLALAEVKKFLSSEMNLRLTS